MFALLWSLRGFLGRNEQQQAADQGLDLFVPVRLACFTRSVEHQRIGQAARVQAGQGIERLRNRATHAERIENIDRPKPALSVRGNPRVLPLAVNADDRAVQGKQI